MLGAGIVGVLLALALAALRASSRPSPSRSSRSEQVDVHAGPWDAAPTDDLVVTAAPAAAARAPQPSTDAAPGTDGAARPLTR